MSACGTSRETGSAVQRSEGYKALCHRVAHPVKRESEAKDMRLVIPMALSLK